MLAHAVATFNQSRLNGGPPSAMLTKYLARIGSTSGARKHNTTHSSKAGSLLGHHLRRWPNSGADFFASNSIKSPLNWPKKSWGGGAPEPPAPPPFSNSGSVSATLNQPWVNMLCLQVYLVADSERND